MNDDWRVRVEFQDDGFAHRLGETLQAEELESDLRRSYADRVVVSIDGGEVFLYAPDRSQAQAAQKLVERLASEHGWSASAELRHWHPEAEIWEDPDNPEPITDAQHTAEDAIRNAGERRDSAEQGYPDWEVRVTCASRREAGELSDRLQAEGIVNVHRWDWVLIGANDEEEAQAVAQRLRGELPNAQLSVELNLRTSWKDRPGNPFAWLGGLAG
jgi:hypothetical protein